MAEMGLDVDKREGLFEEHHEHACRNVVVVVSVFVKVALLRKGKRGVREACREAIITGVGT